MWGWIISPHRTLAHPHLGGQMKKKVVYDLLCYMIVPLLIWNLLREETGDYYAMLLTTVPGFVNTIYSFFKDKTYNVTGIFILVSLILGRALDVMAGTAEQMLWNDIYLNILYIVFWITTILLNKPMGMYFFIDYANLRGFSRRETERFFRSKELFRYFQYYTALLALKSLESLLLRVWCIQTYGVNGFNRINVITNANNWALFGISILYILYIVKQINRLNRGAESVTPPPNGLIR